MQKQEIDPLYLALQTDYNFIEIALFKGKKEISTQKLSKFDASSELIPTIDLILSKNNLDLKKLDFIGASLGPAPFTTLRTVIVTVNGINFASQIPLIGVNSLDLMLEHFKTDGNVAVGILNAFNHDVYFGIKDKEVICSWKNCEQLFTELIDKYQDRQVTIFGKGVEKFADLIKKLPSNFKIADPCPKYSTIEQVASAALEKWQNKETQDQLTPLYMKQAEPV